jgi:heptosyltransferase-1
MKILIVKTSAIGDVIQTLPVIDDLKKRFPRAQIDWVVEYNSFELLSAHPGLSHVFLADVKRWRRSFFQLATWREIASFLTELRHSHYDLVFDFQGNTKSSLFTLLARAPKKVGYGWKTVREKPNWFVTNRRFDLDAHLPIRSRYLGLLKAFFGEEETGDSFCSPFSLHDREKTLLQELTSHPLMAKGPRLMIAFGSHWKNKRLNNETLKVFLQNIQKKYGARFFFPFGNREEEQLARELATLFPDHSLVVGKLPLQVLRELMAQMDGVISMDSAALHLCGTTMTPSFSLFGPSSAAVYKPEGEHHVAFQGVCPYARTFEKSCPLLRTCNTGACLREAPVEELLNRFNTWMKDIKKR